MKTFLRMSNLGCRALAWLLSCVILLPATAWGESEKAFQPYDERVTLSMIYEVDVGVAFPHGDSIQDSLMYAYIALSCIPIMLVFPILSKHIKSGLVLGSVKE